MEQVIHSETKRGMMPHGPGDSYRGGPIQSWDTTYGRGPVTPFPPKEIMWPKGFKFPNGYEPSTTKLDSIIDSCSQLDGWDRLDPVERGHFAVTILEQIRMATSGLPVLEEVKPEVETYSTGAKRGTDHSDCYLHLIPFEALEAYGRAFAEGAKKYGLHNWLKGFPFSGLMNHAQHHLWKYTQGDTSEDHLGHALWNIGAMIYFSIHRPELNDLPPYKSHQGERGAPPLKVAIEQLTTAEQVKKYLAEGFGQMRDSDGKLWMPTPPDTFEFKDGIFTDGDPRIHLTPKAMSLAMMPESPMLDSLKPPAGPHWEVVDDEDKVMSRVRWSEPDSEKKYLWVAHYPFDKRHLAESTAKNWNRIGRHPSEWAAWRDSDSAEKSEQDEWQFDPAGIR